MRMCTLSPSLANRNSLSSLIQACLGLPTVHVCPPLPPYLLLPLSACNLLRFILPSAPHPAAGRQFADDLRRLGLLGLLPLLEDDDAAALPLPLLPPAAGSTGISSAILYVIGSPPLTVLLLALPNVFTNAHCVSYSISRNLNVSEEGMHLCVC